MERFLPNQKISQIHGRAMRRNIPEIGTKVFYALYHPAAALYNGGMRNVLIQDFKKIPKVLEAIGKNKIEEKENSEIKVPEKEKQETLF